jgi:hypothetical protein
MSVAPLDAAPDDDAATGRDAERERAVPWAALDVLVKGSPMLKFGRSGDPHFRHFFLDQRCEYLLWMTHKKASAESRVRLAGCTLAEGQTTSVFRRQRRADLEDVSFSLLYAPSGQKASARGEQRSLDVACKDRREYEAWVRSAQGCHFLGSALPRQGKKCGCRAAFLFFNAATRAAVLPASSRRPSRCASSSTGRRPRRCSRPGGGRCGPGCAARPMPRTRRRRRCGGRRWPFRAT